MFEEDFFEVDELQYKTRDGVDVEYEYVFDAGKYFRMLK
ncbi:hypothetical protein MmiHf6_09760 [Methanimicrococcus hongohii]|uniref:Uncharacterized protein n=1 Tax=Methanimicrococcus hongohii TaxID=3028295 RepID=A0AA96V0G4_9EURY|nr:hypothetical protein MmiHf6_09760 [Methanimicrococcus sp. Hf6]